jgi:hypothetical protein
MPPGAHRHRANIARADPCHVVQGCALRELTWPFLVIRVHVDRVIGPDNAEVAGSIPASPTTVSGGRVDEPPVSRQPRPLSLARQGARRRFREAGRRPSCWQKRSGVVPARPIDLCRGVDAEFIADGGVGGVHAESRPCMIWYAYTTEVWTLTHRRAAVSPTRRMTVIRDVIAGS